VSVPSEALSESRSVSDVIDTFINLPWKKIASWLAVAMLASQLKDFLGVRLMLMC